MIAITVCLTSCGKEEHNASKLETEPIFKLLESKPLTNEILLEKVESNIKEDEDISSKIKTKILINLDLAKVTISDYEETDIKSVVIPISEEYSYITYSKKDKIWEGGMLVKINKENELSIVEYYNLNEEKIGVLEVNNGKITDAFGIYNSNRGWWDDWSDCVADGFNSMFDGSVGGAAVGLLCVAFGPECAAGAALGCAAATLL